MSGNSRKDKVMAFDPVGVHQQLIKSLDGMCNFLISQGHNNEFRNPFKYPFKCLLTAYESSHRAYSQRLANMSMANQAAIISTNSKEGGDYYKEYINKLTEQ